VASVAALLLGTLAMPGTTFADGGLVRARAETGRLTVTLFTSPTPLRAGDADVSVLVQDGRGTALLDAETELRLEPLDGAAAPVVVPLTRGAATNRLLQAATLSLPAPGRFRMTALVRRGTDRAAASADVLVHERAPALRGLAVPLALPWLAIGLFALHRGLEARRRHVPSGHLMRAPHGGEPLECEELRLCRSDDSHRRSAGERAQHARRAPHGGEPLECEELRLCRSDEAHRRSAGERAQRARRAPHGGKS
jgi:hypothetical protein